METREPPYFPISGPWNFWIFSFFFFFNFFLFCKTPKAGFVVWLNILKKKLPPQHTHALYWHCFLFCFVFYRGLYTCLNFSQQPTLNYRINYCKPGGCYDNASRYGCWMLRDSLHGSGFPALIRSHWGDITNLLLAATLKYLSSCKQAGCALWALSCCCPLRS